MKRPAFSPLCKLGAIAILMMVMVSGCFEQNPRSLSKGSTPSAPTGGKGSQSETVTVGGGSDGGGNLIHGKPIEDWARQWNKDRDFHEAYQELLGKLIPLLRQHPFPDKDQRQWHLANFLQSALEQKQWYFVPGPLSAVPQTLTGSVVATSQGALQGHKRVWVDIDLWSKMTVDARATLILHEAVMGLKVLQFQSDRTQCEWAYLQNTPTCSEELDSETRPIQLTAKDYQDVQQNVLTLKSYIAGEQSLDTNFWYNLDENFSYTFPWFDHLIDISKNRFIDIVQTSLRTNNQPRFGLDLGKKSLTSCEWTVNFTGSLMDIKLKASGKELHLHLNLPESWQTPRRQIFNDKGRLVTLMTAPEKVGVGNFKTYLLSFVLTTNDWQGLDIYESSCSDKDCRDSSPVSINGGLNLYCSSSPLNEWLKPKN